MKIKFKPHFLKNNHYKRYPKIKTWHELRTHHNDYIHYVWTENSKGTFDMIAFTMNDVITKEDVIKELIK
jgi:hypothetical protein